MRSYFDGIGADVFRFCNAIKSSRGIRFALTAEQQDRFLQYFRQTQSTYLGLLGDDYTATVRRLGLITYRIAMMLSTLRLFDTGELPEFLICESADYNAAQSIAQVLVQHAAKVFSELLEAQKPPRRTTLKDRFLDTLPEKFNRQQFLQIATGLDIGEKTAERYISQFAASGAIQHLSRDRYEKPANPPVEEIEE